MFGAKLSWCQIVRCQIVLVPNCPGAKLSTFIILVPNCPLLLSWCQIVCFIILVPNCPVPNCPVLNCPVPNCPTILLVPATVWNSAREFFFFFNSSQWSRRCSPKVRKRWYADQTAKHWVMVKPQSKKLSLIIFFRVPMWPYTKWLEWQLHWLYL